MSYTAQRYIAVAVAVVLAMIGAIQLANAETLGITPRMSAWLGILAVGLGILAGFLPSVQGRARDPEFLADRVWELKPADRRMVASDLADRASLEQRVAALRARDPAGADPGLLSRPSIWLPASDDPVTGTPPLP